MSSAFHSLSIDKACSPVASTKGMAEHNSMAQKLSPCPWGQPCLGLQLLATTDLLSLLSSPLLECSGSLVRQRMAFESGFFHSAGGCGSAFLLTSHFVPFCRRVGSVFPGVLSLCIHSFIS